jgi:hypothetical protein
MKGVTPPALIKDRELVWVEVSNEQRQHDSS